MLLGTLKILFAVCGLLLILSFIAEKFFVSKMQDNMKSSAFVSMMAGLLFFYIINAILLSIFIIGGMNKVVMLLFSLSPFIIGRFATYEKLNLYTSIQLLCIFASIIFVI